MKRFKLSKTIRLLVTFILIIGLIAPQTRAQARSMVQNSSPTLEHSCKFQTNTPLTEEEADLINSIRLTCLEYHFDNSKIFDKDSEAYKVLKDILSEKLASRSSKIEALTFYSLKTQKTGLSDMLSVLELDLKKVLFGFSCSKDLKTCDNVIHNLYTLAPVFPLTTLKYAKRYLSSIQKLDYGILQESFKLKLEGLNALAQFYQSSLLQPHGTTPSWKPGVNLNEMQKQLTSTAMNLQKYSELWSQDDLKVFLPIELESELTDVSFIETLSEEFNNQLSSFGLYLSLHSIYADRLLHKNPSLWLNRQMQNCEKDASYCPILFHTLTHFLDVEVKLPYRKEWVHTLEMIYNRHYMNDQSYNIVLYAKQMLYSINTLNWEFSKSHNLMDVFKNEKEFLQQKGFHSLYYEMLVMTSQASIIVASMEALQTDFYNKNLESQYQKSLYDYGQSWFTLQCGAKLIKKDSNSFVIPFSNIKIKSSLCTKNDKQALHIAYEQETLRLWILEPVKEAAVKIGVLATTLVSAGLSLPVGAAISSQLGRHLGTNLLARFALQTSQAAASAFVFTATSKILNGALQIAPLWDTQQGLYGNLIKPWLIGTAIFFVLPYTTVVALKMGSHFTRGTQSALVKNITLHGATLTVDTVTFMSIEYTHRLIEKMMGQRKLVFSGDMKEVLWDNFIFAIAFYATMNMKRTGRR